MRSSEEFSLCRPPFVFQLLRKLLIFVRRIRFCECSAIYPYRLAADVGGLVAHQECNRAAYVSWSPDATQRRGSRPVFCVVRVVAQSTLDEDRTRSNTVHANRIRPKLK